MRFVIRVDASVDIGTGHVMRCLTLADFLIQQGEIVEFLCRPHSGNLIHRIREKGFNVIELSAPNKDQRLEGHYSKWLGASQEQDIGQCKAALENKPVDWLIVDHYAIDERWQTKAKSFCNNIMVIDDLGDREHNCEILLDQNYGTTEQKYIHLVPDYCKILVGSEFTLLRPEFNQWRSYSLDRRNNNPLNRLLVNFGGMDVDNLTALILQELNKLNIPPLSQIDVVMGGSAPHLEFVKLIAKEGKYRTNVIVDAPNMAELMAASDFAIGAAGATAWERCCLALPTILFMTAMNQKDVVSSIQEAGAAVIYENYKQRGLNQLKTSIEVLEHQYNSISKNASNLVDGKGASRVSQVLLGY